MQTDKLTERQAERKLKVFLPFKKCHLLNKVPQALKTTLGFIIVKTIDNKL